MEHGSMEYSSRQRYWVLEIKLVSCKDLKAFNFFQKLSVYAIVSLKVISDDAEKKVKEAEEQMNEEVVEQQIKKTPTDGEGDGNPEWNHEMRFEFDHNDDHRQLKDGRLLIHFDLRHQGLGILGIGDRSIGEVRVPLNDLMIPYIPPSPANNSGLGLGGVQQQQRARYVNYQVRTCDEKPNGILTFSYKLKLLIKGAGTDDQPRIQYPTITLEEDDDDDIMHKFNNTNSDITSSRSQQQQQQQEYYYTSNISSAAPTPAPAPAHNNNNSQSQSQLQADHQQICSSCLPQYHHPYDPPVAVAVARHRTYYPPPPPPPPPPPMADHGASYPYHPPPPGHGMVHPPWPPHPYHDYGPWSPPAGIGRPHGHGHEHGFF
ncbi:unnamed protein product [Prunus armeniaca]|uniref:C2 domain-containing protein n=1 Tax=Prunus armeniaca TaxID=36596 RepID=A0A6J5UGS3_PRUAR|nr:unnamed protein product [Prunus armeniaca]